MKIGHFSFSTRGGAGKVATTLHQHQIEQGLDSTLHYVTSENLAQKPFENPVITLKAIVDKFLVSKYQNPSLFSYYRSNHNLNHFSDLFRSFDIVHFHWIPGVFDFQKLEFPSNSRTKYFWSIQDMWPFTGGCHFSGGCRNFEKACTNCPQVKFPFRQGVHKKFISRERNLLNNMKQLKVIYPSKYIKELASESSMLKNLKFEIIGNPIMINYNTNQPKLNYNQIRILNSINLKIAFVAADLSEFRKGARTLIKWFQENSENLNDLVLVFVGNNGDFIKQSKNILVIPNVTKIDEMNYIYSKVDLNISVSTEETFGYTIIESGLMETPSVCFIGTAQSELIKNGVSGYLIEHIDDLNRIINLVRDTPLLNQKVGGQARSEFAVKFNREIIGKKYIDLYND
jgi:glycosyltransferase involved in cell wall biosynthesis